MIWFAGPPATAKQRWQGGAVGSSGGTGPRPAVPQTQRTVCIAAVTIFVQFWRGNPGGWLDCTRLHVRRALRRDWLPLLKAPWSYDRDTTWCGQPCSTSCATTYKRWRSPRGPNRRAWKALPASSSAHEARGTLRALAGLQVWLERAAGAHGTCGATLEQSPAPLPTAAAA